MNIIPSWLVSQHFDYYMVKIWTHIEQLHLQIFGLLKFLSISNSSGDRWNVKMQYHLYRHSPRGDKTILQQSYTQNAISFAIIFKLIDHWSSELFYVFSTLLFIIQSLFSDLTDGTL